MTDAADAGTFLAEVLIGDGHRNLSYEITGPDLLDFDAVASLIGTLVGRTVRYIAEDPTVYRAKLEQVLKSQWQVAAVCDIFREISAGYFVRPTHQFTDIMGRPAVSVEEFVRARKPLFAPRLNSTASGGNSGGARPTTAENSRLPGTVDFTAPVHGRLPAPNLAASDAPGRRRSVGATFVRP